MSDSPSRPPAGASRRCLSDSSGESLPDWAQHYADGDTPWDHGAAHPELSRRMGLGELDPTQPGARALVPGCGRGHDAHALARRGWAVTAVDQVAALEELVAPQLEQRGGAFVVADALEWDLQPGEPPLDLVLDHTFLCAIARDDRLRFGHLVRRVLKPGGSFVCIQFPVGKGVLEGGPPFGLELEDLLAILGPDFTLVEHCPVREGVPRRVHGEYWSRFQRNP